MPLDAGLYHVSLTFGGPSYPQGAATTFQLASTVGNDEPTPLELAQAIEQLVIASELHKVWTQPTILRGIRVKAGPAETGPFADFSTDINGQGGEYACNPNVAILVKRPTNKGGRGATGRMFFPGLAKNATVDGGAIAGAKRTELQGFFTAFYEQTAAATSCTPYLVSSVDGGAVVTGYVVDAVTASQRRRLR